MMDDLKPWYLSRTIWASGLAAASAIARLAGLPVPGLSDPALADQLVQVVTAAASAVAIVGRLSATSRISLGGSG
jgi:hypothetical protein